MIDSGILDKDGKCISLLLGKDSSRLFISSPFGERVDSDRVVLGPVLTARILHFTRKFVFITGRFPVFLFCHS